MEIGFFLGAWVIGYGIVQASAPAIRKMWGQKESPDRKAIQFWSAVLMVIPSLIGFALWRESSPSIQDSEVLCKKYQSTKACMVW